MTIKELNKTDLDDDLKYTIISQAKRIEKKHHTPFEDGLRLMYNAFMKHYPE